MTGTIIFTDTIHDPIWGDIPVTDAEMEIIQSEYFSRLREIKQMGVAQIEFPGAIHNRFQHSIGVMHVADMMLSMVKLVVPATDEDGKDILKEDEWLVSFADRHVDNLRIAIRIAGLLHDIGHPPLSHLIEELFRKYPSLTKPSETDTEECRKFLEAVRGTPQKYSHEAATLFLLSHYMKDLLNKLFSSHNVNVNEIVKLTCGEASEDGYRLLNPIIVSDFDADKMDYILRDSYFCGTGLKISIQDFRGNLLFHRYSEEIYIKPCAITAANDFLYARYRTIKDVQQKEKCRIATQVLINRVKTSLDTLEGNCAHEEVLNMHLDPNYVDSKLDTLLEKTQGESVVANFRRGKLDHIQFEPSLSHYEFNPITRGCLHSIVSYPPAISKLQEQFRNELGPSAEKLLIDLRNSKPPEFRIFVYDQDRGLPPVYNWSDTARGILRDSINDLTLYFYYENSRKDMNDILSNKAVGILNNMVVDIAAWASDSLIEDNNPIGKDILILIINNLYQWIEKNKFIERVIHKSKGTIQARTLWIYSQRYFQNYTQALLEEIGNKGLTYSTNYSSKVHPSLSESFFRDLEVLKLAGLIEIREEMMDFKTKSKDMEYLYTFRNDYKITEYGKEFAKLICEKSNQLVEINKCIMEFINNWQNFDEGNFQEELESFAISEREMRELRSKESASDERKKQSSERNKIRKRISKEMQCKICLFVI